METSNADMLIGRILSSYIPSECCDLYWAMYSAMIWTWAEDAPDGMDLGRHWVRGLVLFAIITRGRV